MQDRVMMRNEAKMQNHASLTDLPAEMTMLILADCVTSFSSLCFVNKQLQNLIINYCESDKVVFARALEHAINLGNIAFIHTLLETNPDIALLEKSGNIHHSFIMDIIYSKKMNDSAKRDLLEKFILMKADIPIRKILFNDQYQFDKKSETLSQAYRLYMIGLMVDYAIKNKIKVELPSNDDLLDNFVKIEHYRKHFFAALRLQQAGNIIAAYNNLSNYAVEVAPYYLTDGNHDYLCYNSYDFIFARMARYLQELNQFEAAAQKYEWLYSNHYLFPYTGATGTKLYRCTDYQNEVAQLFIAWTNSLDTYNATSYYARLFHSVNTFQAKNLTESTAKQLSEAITKHENLKTVYDTFDEDIHYPYQNMQRSHFNEVEYKGQFGDHAKATILKEFKKQINNIDTIEALDAFVVSLKQDERYTILQTGQGITTIGLNSIFHLKQTTSEQALSKMIEERRIILKNKCDPTTQLR